MKNIPYQQNAINELTDKTIRLLNLGGKRQRLCLRLQPVQEKQLCLV